MGERITIAATLVAAGGHLADVLEGVLAGAEAHGWNVELHEHRHLVAIQRRTGRYRGAFVTRIETGTADGLETLGLPVVNVSSAAPTPPGWAAVVGDDRAVGRLAAEHLIGQGHRNFAWAGFAAQFSSEREAGFREALGAAGFEPRTFPELDGVSSLSERALGLVRALRSGPLPVALLAASDHFGGLVVGAAEETGLVIPGELAVLGVDNDPVFCRLRYPRLSSVQLAGHAIGHRAIARLADALRSGGAVPAGIERIPPVRVVERESTAAFAVADPRLRAVLSALRGPALFETNVDLLGQRFDLSRRTLERLFRQHLGRSPLDEIRRRRVAAARALLANATLTVAEVSDRLGYADPKAFTMAFSAASGESPRAFRRRVFGFREDA